ncbi:MAG: methyltransferase [Microbacteriaceae bacterium]|nr:methyltransferase [Microbacteriaceae bacterium]
MDENVSALVVDAAAVADLAEDLRAARFTVDAVGELWGGPAGDALLRDQPVLARRALRAAGAAHRLAALASLFLLGDAVPADALAAALPTLGLERAAALGLIARRGHEVVPRVDLRPYAFTDELGAQEWWIASDLGELALRSALPVGHVLGVGGASLTLAGLMMPGVGAGVGVGAPDQEARVLDLGTGCGIQALHARRHAAHVVATDISPRALWFTEFNAALNGVTGIETRLGSMFEPVAGERFDRVVSNPPFVITPRTEGVPAYEYRDGGMEGDAIVASFVEGVGAHLEPGGTAQLLGNWEYREGEDGLDRVRGWVEASAVPLDAWVVEREVQDAARYAETWIRDGGTLPGTPEHEALLTAWVDDFERRGVTAVGFGYLLLRRPAGAATGAGADASRGAGAHGEGTAPAAPAAPTLARYERVGQPIAAPHSLGGHLRAALAGHDAQAALSDDELAASSCLVAPDISEARHFRPGDDDPSVIELRQGGGFSRVIGVDPALAALVGACDGTLPIGALIGAIAQLMDAPEPALREELLPRVRELLELGVLVLVPAGAPDADQR